MCRAMTQKYESGIVRDVIDKFYGPVTETGKPV